MTLSEFVRIYPLRAKNMAWLFGAGTSIAAGMPTADDLIWQFKRLIYCSEQGISSTLFSNLADSTTRRQIQSYFDSLGNYPLANSVDEYSFYFEKALSSPRDRSEYLLRLLSGMQNSYGHKVLGVLMQKKLLPLVFTTNFDKAFENAAVERFKNTDSWFLASIDNAETAIQKYQSGFRPFIAKLHGDYFSEKLKNTTKELQEQDSKLRTVLKLSCLSGGLAVMGYSGRDKSVMDVLEESIAEPHAFPAGFFWFIRPGEKPLPSVERLIAQAHSRRIQAELVEIETFDTAWAEIIKGITLSPEEREYLNANHSRKQTTTLPPLGSKYPLLRFNAVQMEEYPTNARVYSCDIGNTKEIRLSIAEKNSNLIAIRKERGIVGFGPDHEFDLVFGNRSNISKDVFVISDKDLEREDSSIKGIVMEGLVKALTRNELLISRRRRGGYTLFPNPRKLSDPVLQPLMRIFTSQITGSIPQSTLKWIISIDISIQVKFGTVFLVILPSILCSKPSIDAHKAIIAAFVKEQTARWYNKQFGGILDAWIDVLFEGAGKKERKLSSHDEESPGYLAKFKLVKKYGVSKNM